MVKQTRLQMIQGIITRLAGSSAAFKGWMITVTSALLGVSINNHKHWLAWLSVYAICVLALLDAYYLALETSYRRLYDEAAAVSDADDDAGLTSWSLHATRLTLGDVVRALKSPSVWAFYASAVIASIVVALSV
jgi:hypothetical protein